MTDIEKLVEWLGCTPAHEMGCSWWRSDRKSLQGRCDCGLTEARELAARVAEELEWLESLSNRLGGRVQELKEELEEAQQLEPNIQRQVKIITGLEMANATLRARVEQLELVEELAWGLIANAWDWVYDDLDWIGAAERWRDNYPSKPAEGEK